MPNLICKALKVGKFDVSFDCKLRVKKVDKD